MEVSLHLKYERTIHLKMTDLSVGRKCKRQNYFLFSKKYVPYSLFIKVSFIRPNSFFVINNAFDLQEHYYYTLI